MGGDMYAEICERLERIERLASLGAKLVLNTDEAAEFLGLSRGRMHHLTAARLIPHYKRGGKLYFRKAELEAWLTGHRVLTDEEVGGEAEKVISRIKGGTARGGAGRTRRKTAAAGTGDKPIKPIH